MNLKACLSIAAMLFVLSSCYKQSIADAMLHNDGNGTTTATMRYEINDQPVTITVKDAWNQPQGRRKLYMEKSGGYVLSALPDNGNFVFVFLTDSLQVGHFSQYGTMGSQYVTDFGGYPQYIGHPGDYMSFVITAHKDGLISGNFSGQLSPAVSFLGGTPVFGSRGGVIIANGSFSNVPVFY